VDDLTKMSWDMREWREKEEGDPYSSCPRGEWLLWYAAKIKADRKKINAAVLSCLNTATLEEPLPDDVDRMLYAMFHKQDSVLLSWRAKVEGRVPEADTLIADPLRLRRWHIEKAALYVIKVIVDEDLSWAFAVAWHTAQIIGHQKTAELVRNWLLREDLSE